MPSRDRQVQQREATEAARPSRRLISPCWSARLEQTLQVRWLDAVRLHDQLHDRVRQDLVEERLRSGVGIRAFRLFGTLRGTLRPHGRLRPIRQPEAAPAGHPGQARLRELIDGGKDVLYRRHSYASPERQRRWARSLHQHLPYAKIPPKFYFR